MAAAGSVLIQVVKECPQAAQSFPFMGNPLPVFGMPLGLRRWQRDPPLFFFGNLPPISGAIARIAGFGISSACGAACLTYNISSNGMK